MIWQDWVMTIGALVLVYGVGRIVFLVKQRGEDPPPSSGTLPIGLVLVTYFVVMLTLGLWLSAVTTLVQAGLWLWLAHRAHRIGL